MCGNEMSGVYYSRHLQLIAPAQLLTHAYHWMHEHVHLPVRHNDMSICRLGLTENAETRSSGGLRTAPLFGNSTTITYVSPIMSYSFQHEMQLVVHECLETSLGFTGRNRIQTCLVWEGQDSQLSALITGRLSAMLAVVYLAKCYTAA